MCKEGSLQITSLTIAPAIRTPVGFQSVHSFASTVQSGTSAPNLSEDVRLRELDRGPRGARDRGSMRSACSHIAWRSLWGTLALSPYGTPGIPDGSLTLAIVRPQETSGRCRRQAETQAGQADRHS